MCEYTVCDIYTYHYSISQDLISLILARSLCWAKRSDLLTMVSNPSKKIQRSSKISRTMRQLLITDTNFRFDPLLEDYPTE
jgi:hypothetical protein